MSDIYVASPTVPICRLEVRKHWDALTEPQQLYAHHIARGSWHGSRIVLQQVSAESPAIYQLLLALFSKQLTTDTVDFSAVRAKAVQAGVTEQEFDHVLQYFVQFLGNLGNYRSFGDTKFIPRASKEAFERVVRSTNNQRALDLWLQVKEPMYALSSASVLMLSHENSAYYPSGVTKDELDLVQRFLEAKHWHACNTRIFKDASQTLIVRIASAQTTPAPQDYSAEGRTIRVEYGDFKEEMGKIAKSMRAAIPFAANEFQRKMLEKYGESFESGSIEAHKDSQRWWIKDAGPVVESNVGFIETYRDPAGVRAEWEGFVSIVNKEQTKKFEALVNSAPTFISKLPWSAAFEKDTFHKPDFTSLEVLAFCTSGIPAGINIPNYDDIRQEDGFKNVSLGNILNAQAPSEVITFLNERDKKLFEKWRGPAFEVQVGIHELLGHGSGKLLEESKDGSFNFDVKNPPVSSVTGKPIASWYKPGESYSSKFGNMAASYEECRAECCGIYLSTDPTILKIFGHGEAKEADDVMYVNWLLMARAGLLALEFYDPQKKLWGQAHMRARYAILRVMLQAQQGLVTLTRSADTTDAIITVDRSKITTVGKQSIGDFLNKLNVYKATADAQAAQALYDEFTAVPEDWMPLRDLVVKKRQPRKVFVQPNTYMGKDGKVLFREYDPTPEGMVSSFDEKQHNDERNMS